jgi:hypothetical protein
MNLPRYTMLIFLAAACTSLGTPWPEERILVDDQLSLDGKLCDNPRYTGGTCEARCEVIGADEIILEGGVILADALEAKAALLGTAPLRSDSGAEIWEVDAAFDLEHVSQVTSELEFYESGRMRVMCPSKVVTPMAMTIRPRGSMFEYRGVGINNASMHLEGRIAKGILGEIGGEARDLAATCADDADCSVRFLEADGRLFFMTVLPVDKVRHSTTPNAATLVSFPLPWASAE